MARPVAQGINRARQQVANAFARLQNRFGAGLPLFNALRKEFKTLPQSWISTGYQLGKSVGQLLNKLAAGGPSYKPRLKDIPLVPGLQILDPVDNRIRYRLRARIMEKYGRAPKTFIIDVNSLVPLTQADLMDIASRQASLTYQASPGARHGGQIKDVKDVQVDLLSVERRY